MMIDRTAHETVLARLQLVIKKSLRITSTQRMDRKNVIQLAIEQAKQMHVKIA